MFQNDRQASARLDEHITGHYGEDSILTDEETETVPDGWACPGCGERRVDHLRNENGHIRCGNCWREYDID